MAVPHGLALISLKDELSKKKKYELYVPTPTVQNSREKIEYMKLKEDHRSGTERMGNKQKSPVASTYQILGAAIEF